jgi:hypothetical protein
MRAWLRQRTGWIPRPVRRIIFAVIGGTFLLLALIGFIVPIMPGFIFLPFGLAILAMEFAWAARWLKRVKKSTKNVRDRLRRGAKASAKSEQPERSTPPSPLKRPNVAA